MISEARLAANRRNAQASTGPRTSQGKRKVSQNARKHGYRAARQLITAAQQREIEEITAVFSRSNPPQDPVQQALLRQMGAAWWNILEFDKLTHPLYVSTDYEYAIARLFTLGRYSAHYENLFYKALKSLTSSEKAPNKDQPEIAQTNPIPRVHRIMPKPVERPALPNHVLSHLSHSSWPYVFLGATQLQAPPPRLTRPPPVHRKCPGHLFLHTARRAATTRRRSF